jgi:hypothetical protein
MCEVYIEDARRPIPANWIVVTHGRIRPGDRYMQRDQDGVPVWISAGWGIKSFAGENYCVIRRDPDPAPPVTPEKLEHMLIAADMLAELGLHAEAEYLRRRYARRAADGPNSELW